MNSDLENLREFARNRDESAFRRIIESHAPMVYGVAWRQTRNRSLAEDVTQMVFAILARKASSIAHQELAGWLHRAAFVETRNARRKEYRREKAMSELATAPDAIMSADPSASLPRWKEIAPYLDEFMARLSPADRQLVVMRYFEQRSYREISETTGRSEEASRKQMQRALDRLGGMFRSRGVAATGTALATLMTAETFCAPPASAAALAAAALKAAPGLGVGVGLTHALCLMSTQTIVKTSVITLVIAAVPLGLLWNQNRDLKERLAELEAHAPPPTAPVAAVLRPRAPALQMAPASSGPEHSARRAAKTENADPQASLPALLMGMLGGQSKEESNRLFDRLTARLSLTGAQQSALRKFLDEKDRHAEALIEKLKKLNLDAGSEINGEQSEEMNRLAEAMEKETSTEDFLATLLTPEQKEIQTKAKAEERMEEARSYAEDKLKEITGHIDLTEEQKDGLYEALASRRLAQPQQQDGNSSTTDEDSDDDNGDDAIIRGFLNAGQMETYIKARDEDNVKAEELMKSLMPGLLKDGGK